MAENKDQSHILALSKSTRQELKIKVGDNIFENDNELITATKVVEVLDALIDSVSNLEDDNIDNRFCGQESFTTAQMTDQGTYWEYELSQAPVNEITLFIDGVYQVQGIDFTVSDRTLIIEKDAEVPLDTTFSLETNYRYLD
jgi:hypothetical protein